MLSANGIKANCMSVTYQRGRQLYETSTFKDIEIYEEEDSCNSGDMCIEGKVKGSGTKWYETKVLTDEESSMLQETNSRRKLKMNQPTAEALKSMIEKYCQINFRC